jgi:glycosyltransferase involved in cell wall biosynthesis
MRPTVSLTIIARDEEQNLPRALGTAHDLADEIIVVDTGSRDATVDVARSFGARVFPFRWTDDFSAARNFALEQAAGDYIFSLDADDILPAPTRAMLKDRLPRLDPDQPCAVALTTIVLRTGAVTDHWAQVRIVPRRADVRWSFPIHESLEPALDRARIPVRSWADHGILHSGYLDAAAVGRKDARNDIILARAFAQDPDDVHIRYHLAQRAFTRGDYYGVIALLGDAPLPAAMPAGLYARDLVRGITGLLAAARAVLPIGPPVRPPWLTEAEIEQRIAEAKAALPWPAGALPCDLAALP